MAETPEARHKLGPGLRSSLSDAFRILVAQNYC